MENFRQKKIITQMAYLFFYKGVLSTSCPLSFSLVWVPHMSLSVSSFTPQASPGRVTIALGAFHWWHPISSAYPTPSLCHLETSRPTMLEPPGRPHSHELCNINTVVP
jgi:hypothetical protein